jgi:hypothetical protein
MTMMMTTVRKPKGMSLVFHSLDSFDVLKQEDLSSMGRHDPETVLAGRTGLEDLQIEDLFGKIYGIERVLLMKKTDALKEVIEKITLIPECKLLFVDVETQEQTSYPKVKNMLALSDLFAYIASNKP